ncbi:MAG: hypothetical protein WCB68_15285 [Pyrinomonadaceae bacterium]
MQEFMLIAIDEFWSEMFEARDVLKKPLYIIYRNLHLLISVYVAYFIIWREMRRRNRHGDLEGA